MSKSSNREALRRLSRKLPSTSEVDKIMDELAGQGDLAVAITAPAMVEAFLERLLMSRFKNSSPELLGKLFQNRGPLSEFHSKVLVAQAFGVITGPMAEEMHSLKIVRNTFAHSKVPLTFENPLIQREVLDLRLSLPGVFSRETDIALSGEAARKYFLLAVRILLIILEGVEEFDGPAEEALASFLA